MSWTDSRGRPRKPEDGPIIDMTPEGEFIDIQREGVPPLSARIIGVAILIAVVAGGLAVAALAFWLALTLIPVAIAGAAIAYGVYRFQIWRARRGLFGGHRDLFRP